jgi:hypothetical protein
MALRNGRADKIGREAAPTQIGTIPNRHIAHLTHSTPDAMEKVVAMFLDLRDQWPPVPPPTPLPETGKPRLNKRGERILGLIVAINLGLLLLAPIAGGSIVQAVYAVFAAIRRW